MSRFALILPVLLLLSGCASFIQKPEVTALSANIVSIDTTGLDIELLLTVENPNIFEVSLLSYTYELEVMSVPVSRGGLQKRVIFPSGRNIEVRLPLRIHHNVLLEIIKRRPDLDRVPYRVDAQLHIDSPFGELKIPVNKYDIVSVPAEYRPESYIKQLLRPFKDML